LQSLNYTLNPSFENLLNMSQANMQQLLNILQSNNDISACLANCSNQGTCKLDQQTLKYICECNANFKGKSCQTDERPCSQANNCLNNGTCINSLNLTSSSCQCPENGLFYGQYCENMRNLCENKTCSFHGYCTQSQNETKCKCYNGYEGDDCEIESNTVKVVKNVQWTTTIICIICIATFMLIILGNDLFNFLKFNRKNRLKDIEKKSQFLKEKFYYVPWTNNSQIP
jgi:hypothetical protein